MSSAEVTDPKRPWFDFAETEEPSLSYSTRVTRLRNGFVDELIDAVGEWVEATREYEGTGGNGGVCDGTVAPWTRDSMEYVAEHEQS